MSAPQTWPTGRLCPATSNLPTRMMATSRKRLCAAMQRREAVGVRSGGQGQEDFMAISAARFPCATCAGRMLPPGLELITKEEGEEMAKQSKIGVCENCGDKGALTGSFGRQVCSTCLKIRSNVNSHLPKIANAVRSLGKGEELIKALIPAGGSLAVQVTATLLQEISGIVGYDGEDPAELVEAVRKRVLTCASCDSEDVLAELREIVGYYVPDQGDKGLVDAVRRMALRDASSNCADCTTLRDDLDRSTRVIEELRAKLTIAQQARDEWEQRAVQAEGNVDALEAELRNAVSVPAPCANNTYLLDIALAVIREEPVPAGKIASLIEAARGRAV